MSNIFTMSEIDSIVRLFSVIPMENCNYNSAKDRVKECIFYGFVVLDSKGNVVRKIHDTDFQCIRSNFGYNSVSFNNSFYHSFEKVMNMSEMERLVDQLMHYMSTYGREALGMKAVPWTPEPDANVNHKLNYANPHGIKVIKAISKAEIIELINNFAKNVTKPSKMMFENFKNLIKYVNIPVDDIASFEFKILKHINDGTVPVNGEDFLRYVIFRLNGSALLIKSDRKITEIKNAACGKEGLIVGLFNKADEKELASIFLRHKKLFLALKTKGNEANINRLRRLANLYHKPLVNDVLNFSQLIKNNDWNRIEAVINRSSVDNLVKLLTFVRKKNLSISNKSVYNIRNGKTFVKTNEDVTVSKMETFNILRTENLLMTKLAGKLSPMVEGKSFYIPAFINYAYPVSNKQMIGSIPYGTFIEVDDYNPVSIGVHWNEDDVRTDLDLHMNSITEHYGWSGSYRDIESGGCVYSGDMTSAHGELGAAEAFYFKPTKDSTYLLSLNKFSGPDKVEYEIFMSRTQIENRGVFDPNTALFPPVKCTIEGEDRSQNLGVFHNKKFYFYGGCLTRGIVPSAIYGDFVEGSIANLDSAISLIEVLESCGATVIRDEKDMTEDTIDLSPSVLTPTTLIDIFKNVD